MFLVIPNPTSNTRKTETIARHLRRQIVMLGIHQLNVFDHFVGIFNNLPEAYRLNAYINHERLPLYEMPL